MQYSQPDYKVNYFLKEIESHLCSLVDVILGLRTKVTNTKMSSEAQGE